MVERQFSLTGSLYKLGDMDFRICNDLLSIPSLLTTLTLHRGEPLLKDYNFMLTLPISLAPFPLPPPPFCLSLPPPSEGHRTNFSVTPWWVSSTISWALPIRLSWSSPRVQAVSASLDLVLQDPTAMTTC